MAGPEQSASAANEPQPAPQAEAVRVKISQSGDQQMGVTNLFAFEDGLRSAKTELELLHIAANDLRRLVGARQAIILRANSSGKFSVSCISSIVLSDKDTPFIRWIEGMIAQMASEQDAGKPTAFDLPAFVNSDDEETWKYPFSHFYWQPLTLKSGQAFAGILFAREQPWPEPQRKLINREGGVVATCWQALYGEAALIPKKLITKKIRAFTVIIALILAMMPVPMTTLAPVEIVANAPQRVTAPIDGVIESILAEPNQAVKAGQEILKFEQTTLRNKLRVAEQELLVAQARYDQFGQASFDDEKARHEVDQARAERQLKKAERDYAADLLARSVIKAQRDGILVYSDKNNWIGRPVKTGERIMQIVGPDDVVAKIEVPVADAIALNKDARVRMFLDANPLSSVPAMLKTVGYQAEPNSSQQLVYRLYANINGTSKGVQIGARGTAQLQGQYVPLSFYLLRRPISALRQHIGL